jgi:hypothetical protein
MTDESGNGADDAAVMVVACRRGGTKVRKAPAQSWTRVRRERFLDALAATANVRMAADAAGMQLRSAYRLRQRDAAFAELWEAALEQGYGRLESELLSSALGERRDGSGVGTGGGNGVADVNAIEPDGDRAAGGASGGASGGATGGATGGRLDPALALQLLTLRRTPAGARRTPRHSYKMVPIEEVERALMKQLEIAERRLRRAARSAPAAGNGVTTP